MDLQLQDGKTGETLKPVVLSNLGTEPNTVDIHEFIDKMRNVEAERSCPADESLTSDVHIYIWAIGSRKYSLLIRRVL